MPASRSGRSRRSSPSSFSCSPWWRTWSGAFALDLHGVDLLAVTVIAALPTAQNVFTHAVRYDRGVILARDTIFITTLLSVPVLILIAALLA